MAVTCICEHPQIALAQFDTLAFGRSSSFSIARWVSRASVGCATSFSCTVVPDTTRSGSLVSIVPLQCATERLSCNSAAICSSGASRATEHQGPLSYNERYKHFDRLIVLGFHLASVVGARCGVAVWEGRHL